MEDQRNEAVIVTCLCTTFVTTILRFGRSQIIEEKLAGTKVRDGVERIEYSW